MDDILTRLISCVGLLVMILLALAMGKNRRHINWRIAGGGVLAQLVLAIFVMRTEEGNALFTAIGAVFAGMLNFVDEGSAMVFGDNYTDFFFAFKVLPTIIFFSSLMAVLYFLNIVQPLVRLLAWTMRVTLRTSGAETLGVAANIFVGQTEAPLVVKPYVPAMTRSELMSLMVGGFATISGGILAAYIGMGIDATHLVSASVISAPAALVIAKLLEPETEIPLTLGKGVTIQKTDSDPVNVVDAAARGAGDGLTLALNVGAMLIAFLALLAGIDWLVGFVGDVCERVINTIWSAADVDFQWGLASIMGWFFAPLAWLMGIQWSECSIAGELLGYKLFANEFIAYEKLTEIQKSAETALSERTTVILTYALCGFANFGSIGIQLAGIGGIAPSRRSELAKLAVRAMLGGTLAAFMTGCFAGMLYGVPWDIIRW
jgi:CNT family concentrative nucleoside transporter